MEVWITEQLSALLNFEIPDDLVEYIITIQNNKDLEEYMKTLLDFNNQKHKIFFNKLVEMKSLFGVKKKKAAGAVKKSKTNNTNDAKIKIEKSVGDTSTGKKKSKFVNLYSQDGHNAQVVLLKGRHRCDCEARKHKLINNCMKCGRIVCEQEGSGPCLFCGNIVCTWEEKSESNKNGGKLMKELMSKSRPEGWEAALAHRNKLLEYDRTSERRTRVTDDDSDYFSANSVWLNPEEKAKMEKYMKEIHEAKHASRRNKKITFDFAGREIIEEKATDHLVNEDIINGITSGVKPTKFEIDPNKENESLKVFDAFGDRDLAPGFDPAVLEFDPNVAQMNAPLSRRQPNTASSNNGSIRVQDVQIQEIIDQGKCMSMHQPWASLLVEGIKKHEGRTWYTSHRGKLWIASTAQPPDHSTTQSVENMYRVLYNDDEIKFPSFYPTGCLLGCVNVDDCLPQEEYRKIYPEGESDSPFVFICSNPTSLRLRFPIKGQHKIYPLDKNIHRAAVKSIQKFAKLQN